MGSKKNMDDKAKQELLALQREDRARQDAENAPAQEAKEATRKAVTDGLKEK